MAKGYKTPRGGGSAGMMQQLQKLQEQLQTAQESLTLETVVSTSGGGAVSITMTGDQRCTDIKIQPEIIKENDVEMIQDLVLTAINGALEKSKQLAAERLGPLTGGLPF
jgi:DNA-binding YbaB/EbfC family protein